MPLYIIYTVKDKLSSIFHKNFTAVPSEMTCGGASRAILGANLRTQLQSRTEVHSFSFALIYPQPCATIHPPVEYKRFWISALWWRGAWRTRVLLAQNKSYAATRQNTSLFPPPEQSYLPISL